MIWQYKALLVRELGHKIKWFVVEVFYVPAFELFDCVYILLKDFKQSSDSMSSEEKKKVVVSTHLYSVHRQEDSF